MLECNIDDMNPEIYSYLYERLFAEGAKDVFLTPIYMKKNRPGTLVNVLVEKELEDQLIKLLFKETTTLGIRKREVERETLKRVFTKKKTPLGELVFKEAYYDGQMIKSTPEYEDCRKIAIKHQLPIREVYDIVLKEGSKKP